MALEMIQENCPNCGSIQEGFRIPDGRFICKACSPEAIVRRWQSEWDEVLKEKRKEEERLNQKIEEAQEKREAHEKALRDRKRRLERERLEELQREEDERAEAEYHRRVRQHEAASRRYEDEKLRLAGGIREEDVGWSGFASTLFLLSTAAYVILAILAFMNLLPVSQTYAIVVTSILAVNAFGAYALHRVCDMVSSLRAQFIAVNSKMERLARSLETEEEE